LIIGDKFYLNKWRPSHPWLSRECSRPTTRPSPTCLARSSTRSREKVDSPLTPRRDLPPGSVALPPHLDRDEED
jgi:hypothetical protein